MNIGAENSELFIAAQVAITKLHERGTRTGIWRFDGPSAEIVRNATEIYETQSENAFIDELRKAYKTVIERLIIDNFAGGGGTSTGLEAAFGRPVDIAINHDPEALAMHAANHPHTKHLCESVWDIDPIQ
eukprot:gene6780-6632_t